MTRSDFDFDDLIGGEFDFFGCADHHFKLDDTVFEATEDDGSVEIEEASYPLPPFGLPLARVAVEACDASGFVGHKLIDLHNAHCWLRFGTEIHDTSERSYDALAVFEYTPKPPQEL